MATEKRLIDANAVERLRYTHIVQYWDGKLLKSLPLSEAPTVDAVEVVRCKDCKHGMKSHLQPRHAKNYLCRHSWEGEYHEPDHFCSYGERKDNGC